MRISFDLDGCLWEYPELARIITSRMGWYDSFGILTAHRDIREQADLVLIRLLGLPTPDFFYSKSIHSKESSLDFKERMVLEHDIDIHFDDCEYGKFSKELKHRLGERLIVLEGRGEEYEDAADFFYSLII